MPEGHRAIHEGPFFPGATLSLSADQGHHLQNVLRARTGETVTVVDGKGQEAVGEITALSPQVRIRITAISRGHSSLPIQLAFGVPKGEALDLIIRKGTELGVSSFHPLLTQHSIHPGRWNSERWERIVREVCKQCQRSTFPTVHSPTPLLDWRRSPHEEWVFCDEENRSARLELSSPSTKPLTLFIGSEGGWSGEERGFLLGVGALAMGLGDQRLRAETAALAGLIALKTKLGEIG